MKIRTFIKTLILGVTILASGNAMAAGADGWNGRGLSDGLVVSFCGNNGKFLSSENGNMPMTANRSAVGAWEKFTVVQPSNLGFNQIFLRASNGKYVRRVLGTNELIADATSTAGALLFVSNDNVNNAGQHSLNFRGRFLSSENGAIPVRVNRSAVGLWERWDVQAY